MVNFMLCVFCTIKKKILKREYNCSPSTRMKLKRLCPVEKGKFQNYVLNNGIFINLKVHNTLYLVINRKQISRCLGWRDEWEKSLGRKTMQLEMDANKDRLSQKPEHKLQSGSTRALSGSYSLSCLTSQLSPTPYCTGFLPGGP